MSPAAVLAAVTRTSGSPFKYAYWGDSRTRDRSVRKTGQRGLTTKAGTRIGFAWFGRDGQVSVLRRLVG
jgi:hypothetical protein